MSRSRNFSVFLNGDDRKEQLKKIEEYADWYIGQDEIGNHGMAHIQLAFGFKNPRFLTAVIRKLQNENIQPAQDLEKLIKYVTDENKREDGGELYVFGEVPQFTKKKISKEVITEAIETGDYVTAMRMIEEKDPLYYIANQKKLSLYFCEKFDNIDKALYNMNQFNIKPFTNFSKVLVFIGSTGLGKTQFALAHFERPLHIRDKEDWRRYNNNVDGIILDDLDFPSWSPLTFLKLLDLENPITQNVKYGSIRIKAQTPRIICVNHDELLWPRNIHDETKAACLRRMEIHRFEGKLFTINKPITPIVPDALAEFINTVEADNSINLDLPEDEYDNILSQLIFDIE